MQAVFAVLFTLLWVTMTVFVWHSIAVEIKKDVSPFNILYAGLTFVLTPVINGFVIWVVMRGTMIFYGLLSA